MGAIQLDFERWDPPGADAMRACHQVHRAAAAADDPAAPPMSFGVFKVWLAKGWESDPGEVWFIPGESAGSAAAFCRISLPDLENKDRAFVEPVVHPAARRGGIGRALLRHAARRAAANGRVIMDSVAVRDSAGDAFARRVGAKPTILEIRRVQDLRKIAPGQIGSLRETAERKAAGYSLVSWAVPVPDEYLGHVAAVFNAFADAPHGEGHEAAVWDARRVRERGDTLVRSGATRGYTVAAVHDGTGDMAAITQVLVDPEKPEWGYQGLTAVTRAHRGHRLGLLTKAAMLQWLAETEPKLERIETGNAAANEHMIAVNEALGYEIVEPGYQFCELPVTDATGL
jgi:RimJ/RimL family protein N-acetyltransferase